MRTLVVLTILTAVSAVSIAAGNKSGYREQNAAPLVAPELVKEAGWDRNWKMNLPLKKGETIDEMGVMGTDLFVLTNTNVLFSINRKKGAVRITKQLSSSTLPIHAPFFYDNQFWFTVGNEVLVFDPSVGDFTIKQKFREVGSSAECGLTRNKSHIYLSGSDNMLHAFNADGFWQHFVVTADNDSPISSVVARDDLVVFATKAGNVVGMKPDKAEKVWQFDATGDIRGKLVLDGESVFVGSYDSKLYKLGLEKGMLEWKQPFHSGAPIRDDFSVGRKLIYLYNVLNGLYGVNKETGKAVWHVPSGKGMVCESDQYGYVFSKPGILKVLDNTSGKELYSVNVAEIEHYANNTTDAVMYLADLKGRIMSISVQ